MRGKIQNHAQQHAKLPLLRRHELVDWMIATYHSIVSSIRLDFALYVSYLTPSTWMRIKAFFSYGRFFHHIFLLDICWLLSSFFTCYPFSPDLPHIVRQIVRSKSSINLIDSGQLMFIMWWKKKLVPLATGIKYSLCRLNSGAKSGKTFCIKILAVPAASYRSFFSSFIHHWHR